MRVPGFHVVGHAGVEARVGICHFWAAASEGGDLGAVWVLEKRFEDVRTLDWL